MLARFRGADQGALAHGVSGIFEHLRKLFVLGAGFLPFVRVVENLRAPVLHFGGGIGKFIAKLLVQAADRALGVLRFVGEGEFVIERLIILSSGNESASSFVGASAEKQQRRLR